MKLLLISFLSFILQSTFGQKNDSDRLMNKAFIYKPQTDSLSKEDFLKQEYMQLISDSLVIHSFVAYFSVCPNVEHNGDPVTYVPITGNSLKDSIFLKLLNERHFPVCITFDNIYSQNKQGNKSLPVGGFMIKIYEK